MKYKAIYKFISFLTISLMLILPLTTLAQLEVKQNPSGVELRITPDNSIEGIATRAAIRDVERDINKPMWLAIGCMFPGVGLLAPYFFKPPIPAGRLLGKSPEFVAYYSDVYHKEMERHQFSLALGGCIVGGVASGGCLILSITGCSKYIQLVGQM